MKTLHSLRFPTSLFDILESRFRRSLIPTIERLRIEPYISSHQSGEKDVARLSVKRGIDRDPLRGMSFSLNDPDQ